MAFQLSPGSNWSEIDGTTIVPAVGTTEGAFAGDFAWGPVNKVFSVGDENDLVKQTFKPDSNTFISFFTCADFLSYAKNLRIVRAASNTATNNATSGGRSLHIPHREDYELNYLAVPNSNTYGMFAARYPGELGNSLKVSLVAEDGAFAGWAYNDLFDSAPGTSVFASSQGGANDEMHIAVVDEDGKFTGVAGTVLERFAYASKASDAKNDDGSSNYYVNVINERSQYIYILNHAQKANLAPDTTTWGLPASGVSFTQGANTYSASLANGTFAMASDADICKAYDKFVNAEEVDVALVMTGGHSKTVQQYVIDNLSEVRKDCITYISPARANVVNNVNGETDATIAHKNAVGRSSSYYFMDSGWKYRFDKYNNVYRWVPLNGDMAGLTARTDFERDPWFSPAGHNRGQVKNVVRLAWNPSKGQRDDLYKNGINPVVTFPGDGTLLYGDKTGLAKPSAFDRIGVRRLFIVLEKAITRASKYSLFEFNDEFTRAQFVALVEPYLRDVQGRRGIYDFRVVCDTTNNTPEVIDRNEFIGDIYIKPARSINFIQLNFIAVRTGVAFEEIVGRFG